jgi:hypothetical protein
MKVQRPPIDWIAVLKSGPTGVKKWNRLTASERTAIDLSRADLSNCDLSGINLRGVTAKRASFANCILTAARLPAHNANASYQAATLSGASLTGSDFDGVDFSRANLAGADLTGSHFRKASFVDADLSRADFTDISLLGADLTGANLTDVVFGRGWFDKNTKWPQGFLPPGELSWHGSGSDPRLSGKGKKAVAADINGLMTRLHKIIDAGRMKRTLDMLKSGKNELFAEVEPTMVRGIVRSQKEPELVYSCVLIEDGTYACCTPDVELCLGLRGEPCKHILVLLIGLARAGRIEPATADRWVSAGANRNHRWNKTTKNHVSDTLLKYKGVVVGEIDWRPTETIPEDFYAM